MNFKDIMSRGGISSPIYINDNVSVQKMYNSRCIIEYCMECEGDLRHRLPLNQRGFCSDPENHFCRKCFIKIQKSFVNKTDAEFKEFDDIIKRSKFECLHWRKYPRPGSPQRALCPLCMKFLKYQRAQRSKIRRKVLLSSKKKKNKGVNSLQILACKSIVKAPMPLFKALLTKEVPGHFWGIMLEEAKLIYNPVCRLKGDGIIENQLKSLQKEENDFGISVDKIVASFYIEGAGVPLAKIEQLEPLKKSLLDVQNSLKIFEEELRKTCVFSEDNDSSSSSSSSSSNNNVKDIIKDMRLNISSQTRSLFNKHRSLTDFYLNEFICKEKLELFILVMSAYSFIQNEITNDNSPLIKM